MIQCGYPGWSIEAAGLMVDNRFTAGGGRPDDRGGVHEVWFVEGTYEAGTDRLRGTIQTSTPGRMDRHTFFLHPVHHLPAP